MNKQYFWLAFTCIINVIYGMESENRTSSGIIAPVHEQVMAILDKMDSEHQCLKAIIPSIPNIKEQLNAKMSLARRGRDIAQLRLSCGSYSENKCLRFCKQADKKLIEIEACVIDVKMLALKATINSLYYGIQDGDYSQAIKEQADQYVSQINEDEAKVTLHIEKKIKKSDLISYYKQDLSHYSLDRFKEFKSQSDNYITKIEQGKFNLTSLQCNGSNSKKR